jgi:hypothetical protein
LTGTIVSSVGIPFPGCYFFDQLSALVPIVGLALSNSFTVIPYFLAIEYLVLLGDFHQVKFVP